MWKVFCLLMAGLLVACNASNPPRESPDQPAAGAHPELVLKAAGEEAAPLDFASVEESAAQGDGYQIGAFDLLKIDVFQVPELSQTVRVNSKGYISLPLIGSVQISGLTSQQLEVYLAKLLGEKYLQSPQVTVFIEEYTSQRVTIEGAVSKPDIYPLMGQTTLLQAIAKAGGLTSLADEESVKLLRAVDDNTRQIFYYDIEAIRAGATPDPEIQNNDILVVEKSQAKVFLEGFSNYFRVFLNPLIFF